MLVFVSDIHLTDGTSGTTIDAKAFETFAFFLEKLARKAKAQELMIVFLGDIFDVIRSDFWLATEIRPWSKDAEKDKNGFGLKECTKAIVDRICKNPNNIEAMGYLKDFKKTMADSFNLQVKFTYITGNHDWLINCYESTREQIAGFLGMDKPDQYNQKDKRFPLEDFWSSYKVFARHGDIYDPFNYDGNRNASSLGDAIVIDLINKFPRRVESEIKPVTDEDFIDQLKEIDNVRPLIQIPCWVQGVCQRAEPERGELVKKVWNQMVDEFFEIPFVKAHDRFLIPDLVDFLEMAFKISQNLSFSGMAQLISHPLLSLFLMSEKKYLEKAYREKAIRNNEADYVLYGHTHNYLIQPLDQMPMNSKLRDKTYFNTGTWRKVHEKTVFDTESQEFLSWHVMTFIAFYLKEERWDMKFEVWNGALG